LSPIRQSGPARLRYWPQRPAPAAQRFWARTAGDWGIATGKARLGAADFRPRIPQTAGKNQSAGTG